MQDRVRKVDVEKMSVADVELLSNQLGEKVRQICDKAVEDANKILNIYGLQAKMQFALEKQEQTST